MVKKQEVSIFNDVLGPIMSGPSSSHTAGPTRIGRMCYDLMDGDIEKVHIAFDSKGSFASTYKGQKSDRGFAAGLLGYGPESQNLSNALEIAKNKNIDITFEVTQFPANHPNTAKIYLENKNESKNVTALSLGGGMISIIDIDQIPISIHGDLYEILIFLDSPIQSEEAFITNLKTLMDIEIFNYEIKKTKDVCLLHIQTRHYRSKDNIIKKVSNLSNVKRVSVLSPVLPVTASQNVNLPFKNGKEMLAYAEKNDLKLWEIGLIYEMERSGWTKKEVFNYLEKIISYMRESINKGLNEELKMMGFLEPKARQMNQQKMSYKRIPSGVLEDAIIWSTAVMECNSSMGVVVAAPTAGSCGVLPGIILSTADSLNLDIEKQVKAMLAAGIVGVLIAENSTFAAEVGGCQAEIGSSTGMAAAGLIELLDGSAQQSFRASAMALQNILGLICDPVAGVVDIPCINRNAMGISNAVVSANMAMMGFDPVIPLDEVIKAMKEVGDAMPSDLKCTGCGGLCTTESAKKITINNF
ncbi:L-serine ammonia-lyase, iron-sulfur-dependent, subunit alpha [Mammaliicoccus sciuri]|uniref:L-serine ammonia-lyase, iron-sulfur-dependent, subunit alpha n=1 Tax=Mammaliicoccus sciuri TaxID=1296 RepID=UPI001FB1A6A6|nr:L-serine ammonia-lyase, iron-sulfur-dependent, subunit alpha [Mammaliicoccus sciuri]MCJ0952500.1 L-serine ammonia-lyase, iron-sulfur-dependent, subunit alpha [Mammaliicoccus sciuri]